MRTIKEGYRTGRAEVYSNQYYNAPEALYLIEDTGEPVQLAIISAGTSDNVILFEEAGEIYIYTGNDSLGYMGLEVYEIGNNDRTHYKRAELTSVFLDCEGYRELEHLQPINRAKRMKEFLPYE